MVSVEDTDRWSNECSVTSRPRRSPSASLAMRCQAAIASRTTGSRTHEDASSSHNDRWRSMTTLARSRQRSEEGERLGRFEAVKRVECGHSTPPNRS